MACRWRIAVCSDRQHPRVPVATLRDWEQHRRSPDAPARTMLGMVDADPDAALALIERSAGCQSSP